MTRGANIIQCRSAIRCEALAAWRQIRSDLEAVGLKLKLFGSLARGGFSSHSDIDILVQLGKAVCPDQPSNVSSARFRVTYLSI